MTQKDDVRRLLDEHGMTYASEAGVTLRDKPSPLYQLMVLTLLSSARISADIAMASARELFAAGWRTPQKMRDATWQQRVDALVRGGYRRYDESTSTQLEKNADYLLSVYDGDLRNIRPGDGGSIDELLGTLTGFPRIGPIGARIFCREVQDVWPEVSPFFDDHALEAAERLGLPTDADKLASLAPRGRVADLAAALVRVDLD